VDISVKTHVLTDTCHLWDTNSGYCRFSGHKHWLYVVAD